MKLKKITSKFISLIMSFTLVFSAGFTSLAVYAEEETAFKYGDVNADGEINAGDALLALQHAAKITELSETAFAAGNVSKGDESVDANDALFILKYAAKIIDRFPIEEVIQPDPTTGAPSEPPEPTDTEETPVPTDAEDTPVPTGTEGTPVPTETEDTPAPTETEDTPAPTGTEDTPAPTEVVKEVVDVEIKAVNNAATYDDANALITFLEVGENTEGVEIVNPFVGQDASLGGAFSFWINSPNSNVEGNDWGYDSLISIVNKDQKQIIKFDIQGTRQYSNTFFADKLSMNYWNAYLPLQAGEDAFITCVVCYEGLKMYCNGREIGFISYSGAEDGQCRDLIKSFITNDNTRIFIGGTADVESDFVDICKHSLPADVKVWDLTAYKYSMTPEEAKELYDKVIIESGKVTPSPEPTIDPNEATAAIPAEVISFNEVATQEGTTFTFNDPKGFTDGVEIKNPLAGVENANGGTFSFWFTPAVDYDGQAYTYTSLMMIVNPGATDLLKFDCEGTRQFQDTVNSKKMNYYATDAKLTAGTEYFITVTIHEGGLEYFINGEKLAVGEWYSDSDPGTARKRALNLLFSADSRLFIGGSSCVPEKHLSLVQQKLPAGTKVRDFCGYKSVLTDEYIKDLYNSLLTGEPMPTPTPSETPSEAPELSWTPVEVKALNDVATYDNGTLTMAAAPTDGTGVQLVNPFIGKALTGATISYWLNPGVNSYSQYDSVAVLAFAKGTDTAAKYIKVDLSGTGQYRIGGANAYNWWHSTAGNPVAGTEIFVTVVIGDDSTVKYYVNGVQCIANGDGSGSQATLASSVVSDILTSISTDAEMYIGGYATTDLGNKFIMNRLPEGTTIRNMQTYDAALTAEEVAELYNTSK